MKLKGILTSGWCYMILLGIMIEVMLDSMNPANVVDHNKLKDYFLSVFITVVIWKGTKFIYMQMSRHFPWERGIFLRVFVHGLISSVFSITVIYFSMVIYNLYICKIPNGFRSEMISSSIIIGTLVTFLMIAISSGAEFFNKWKETLIESEKHKKESVQAQLENLRSQVNPHFLFNNLSVLTSLVYRDQDKAVDFINQLAKVYRYVLESKNVELIELRTEMDFVNSYCYLLKIRFEDKIRFEINSPDSSLSLLVAPMSLQLLLENAIKHNEISEAQPLTITISVIDNLLVVSNNLQLRKSVPVSSKTGLSNIISRYHHYTDREVRVINTGSKFEVYLPLLNQHTQL